MPLFLKATGGLGFPGGSVVKNTLAKAGDTRLIPGWGRSPGEGIGNLLQYSCLENPMDRGAWWATVREMAKESDTDLVTREQQVGQTTLGFFFPSGVRKSAKDDSSNQKQGQASSPSAELTTYPLPSTSPTSVGGTKPTGTHISGCDLSENSTTEYKQ